MSHMWDLTHMCGNPKKSVTRHDGLLVYVQKPTKKGKRGIVFVISY